MILQSEFLKTYEELDSLFEGKNKKGKVTEPQNKLSSNIVDKVLRELQLVPISSVFDVPTSTSATGWTVLIPENRAARYKKELFSFDIFLERKLIPFIELIEYNGRPHPRFAREYIKNNNGRAILEIDFGALRNNQWRGLGFILTKGDTKYFIIGNLFMKDFQKIMAGSAEVTAANNVYDSVMNKLERLSN